MGIYRERARTLQAVFEVARQRFATDPALRSVMLACSQYWCDEADDAVQEDVRESSLLVPTGPSPTIDVHLRFDVVEWRANGSSMWAFAALCNEEGFDEIRGVVDPALKGFYANHDSPVLLVQRAGEELRGSWLGRPMRAWLDFPTAMQDRERFGEPAGPPPVPEPPPPSWTDRERELYAEVIASPFERGPRDVLRDLWLERGDPRGDYCIASDPLAIDHARAATLIAAHGRSWVGALQPVIPLSGARFGYGPFLQAVVIYGDAATLAALADAPEWRTVERVEFAPGSARVLQPWMKQLRALGPLGLDDLGPSRDGTWQLEELVLELDRDPAALATLALPLARLCVRPARSLDASWFERLGSLVDAPWWRALEGLEIWLPGGGDDPAAAIVQGFEAVAAAVPDKPVAVGMLDADQATGWMLVRRDGTRRLELRHPDPRLMLGPQLAEITGLPCEPGMIELDDWLTFAVGVAAIQPVARAAPATASLTLSNKV